MSRWFRQDIPQGNASAKDRKSLAEGVSIPSKSTGKSHPTSDSGISRQTPEVSSVKKDSGRVGLFTRYFGRWFAHHPVIARYGQMSLHDSTDPLRLIQFLLENPTYNVDEAVVALAKKDREKKRREAEFPLVVYLWPREMVA